MIAPALIVAYAGAPNERVTFLGRLAVREGHLPLVVHEAAPWLSVEVAARAAVDAARLVGRMSSQGRLWCLLREEEEATHDAPAPPWLAPIITTWRAEVGRSTSRVRRGPWSWWSRACIPVMA